MSAAADPISQYAEEEDSVRMIRFILKSSGRVFIVLKNPWWGNEKAGEWGRFFFADILDESDKAILFSRFVSCAPGVSRCRRIVQSAQNESNSKTPDLPPWLAWGEPERRRFSGWVPKSAIRMMVTADQPDDYTLFLPDGSVRQSVPPGRADAVIRERCLVQKRRTQYKKLAVDCDFDTGQTIKNEVDWGLYHPGAWYYRDEFMCWTVDDKPERVGRAMARAGVATAIHQWLL